MAPLGFRATGRRLAANSDRPPTRRKPGRRGGVTVTHVTRSEAMVAVKHGYRDAARLKTDPPFAPVRSRPDFQEVVAELEKGQKLP